MLIFMGVSPAIRADTPPMAEEVVSPTVNVGAARSPLNREVVSPTVNVRVEREVVSPTVNVGVARSPLNREVVSPTVNVGVRRPLAIAGDVNGDGRVDMADLTWLIGVYIGLNPLTDDVLRNGDTMPVPGTGGADHGDSQIRGNDINWLYRFLNGLEAPR